jgi:hypothetical protein
MRASLPCRGKIGALAFRYTPKGRPAFTHPGVSRKTRTILESGISGHGLLRFVYLDPPGLIRSWEMTGITLVYSLGNLHRNAFDNDTGGHVFPERDQ